MLARNAALVAAFVFFAAALSARAETTVQITGLHLCCGACVNKASKAVQGVAGATATFDKDAGTCSLRADSDQAAQAALDALASAGFHGETSSETLKMKDDSGAPAGPVAKLTVSGIHNCCGGCTKAIKSAVGSVAGVKGNTLKNKGTSFQVTGSFEPGDLVRALNAAGFHVKVGP